MAAMCSGVLPQQDPMTETPARRARTAPAAITSGVPS